MKINKGYLWIWFKDQLQQPQWARNFFINRRAWDAFSKYSHIRRSDQQPKRIYASKEEALVCAKKLSKRYRADDFDVYCCFKMYSCNNVMRPNTSI